MAETSIHSLDLNNSILLSSSQQALHDLLKFSLSVSTDYFTIHDHMGCFVYSNLATQEALAKSPEDIQGKTWRELGIPPEFGEHFESRLQSMIENSTVHTKVINLEMDGKSRYFEHTLRPYTVPDGEITLILSTVRDISNIKGAEKASQESENRFRFLLENAPTAIIFSNQDGIIQEVNKIAETISGYDRSELIGSPIEMLIPERYQSSHVQLRQKYMSQPEYRKMGQNLELFARKKDGTEFPVDIGLSAIKTPEGFLVISYVIDITERYKVERALKHSNERLGQSLAELARHNQALTLLSEMGDMLLNCANHDEAYAVITSFARQIFPNHHGVVYLMDENLQQMQAVLKWQPEFSTPEVINTQDCWALRRGLPHIVQPPHSGLYCSHIREEQLSDEPFSICIPMLAQGEIVGLFHLLSSEKGKILSFDKLASMVSESITMSLSNLDLRERLRQQSIRDPLTGLYNRRYMEEVLTHEISRASRYHRPLSVVIFDIDHFKSYNDRFGHPAGDKLLQALGAYLLSNLRGEDVACRYGGEEILLILPDTDLEQCTKLAHKILQGIRELKVTHDQIKLPAITISMSAASFPKHGDNKDRLLASADKALYQAKDAGRDRFVIAD